MSLSLKLQRARTLVLREFPYLAPIVLRLPIVMVDFPTAFVTRKGVIGIGRGFEARLTSGDLAFILLHEASHWMWMHFARVGARDPAVYNMAGDLVINETWRRACNGKAITAFAEGLYPEQFGLPWVGEGTIPTVDQVYDELIKQGQKGDPRARCGSGASQPVDEEGQAPGEAEGGEEEAREAASLASGSIADALRKAGAGSAELDLWADVQMRRPTVDPLAALRSLAGRLLSSGRRVESTWERPNRRGFQYLQGTRRFTSEVTVIVDTSGSMMGEEDGAHVLGQVYGVLSKLGVIRLVLCDTEVTFDGKVTSLGQFRAACKGGGGTDLTPALRVCENAQAVIVLTDGYLGRPDSPATDRALWVVTRPEAVHDWMKKRIVLNK